MKPVINLVVTASLALATPFLQARGPEIPGSKTASANAQPSQAGGNGGQWLYKPKEVDGPPAKTKWDNGGWEYDPKKVDGPPPSKEWDSGNWEYDPKKHDGMPGINNPSSSNIQGSAGNEVGSHGRPDDSTQSDDDNRKCPDGALVDEFLCQDREDSAHTELSNGTGDKFDEPQSSGDDERECRDPLNVEADSNSSEVDKGNDSPNNTYSGAEDGNGMNEYQEPRQKINLYFQNQDTFEKAQVTMKR